MGQKGIPKMRSMATLVEFVFLFLAGILVDSALAVPQDDCQNITRADVYFLLDSSNSIADIGWRRELNFTVNMIEALPYGPQDTQFAYGIFSSSYQHVFDLDRYPNRQEAQQDVSDTQQLRMNTNTALALRGIRENGYLTDPDLGSRPFTQKVIILITDGQSDNPSQTVSEAVQLQQLGITIFVIGVGVVNVTECRLVAGEDRNFFGIRSFGVIESIKEQLTQRICQATTTTPKPTTAEPTTAEPTTPEPTTIEPELTEPTTAEPLTTEPDTTTQEPTTQEPTTKEPTTQKPTTQEPTTRTPTPIANTTVRPLPCIPSFNNSINVMFVFDFSGSIGETKFRISFQFLLDLVRRFNCSGRFGLITYGTFPRLFTSLTGDKELFTRYLLDGLQAEEGILNQGSNSNLDLAFDVADPVITFDPNSSGPTVCFVVTNRGFENRTKTLQAALKLKNKGINIVAIGVGSGIDPTELNAVVTRPEWFLRVNAYINLQDILANIIFLLCCR